MSQLKTKRMKECYKDLDTEKNLSGFRGDLNFKK